MTLVEFICTHSRKPHESRSPRRVRAFSLDPDAIETVSWSTMRTINGDGPPIREVGDRRPSRARDGNTDARHGTVTLHCPDCHHEIRRTRADLGKIVEALSAQGAAPSFDISNVT